MMKQQGPVVEFEYWDSPLLGLQLALCVSFNAVHIFFIGVVSLDHLRVLLC
jgi:hypothetical protein